MVGRRVTMEGVAEAMRQRITSGEWKPGCQIPIKARLRGLFGASDMTVQRALNLLYFQGFTRACGCKGTYVVENPPHLYRYGLILSWRAESNLMNQALLMAAERETAAGRRVSVHEDCRHLGGESATEAMITLEQEVAASQFAGLILAAPPFHWTNSPVLRMPKLPRVFITPDVPPEQGVGCHLAKPLPVAFEELARRGCRRVAVIATVNMTDGGESAWLASLHAAARSAGLEFRDPWGQSVPLHPPAVRQTMRLLLALPCQSRPDGLYIADDHLIAPICEVLATTGWKNMRIMAHGNYPNLQRRDLPLVHVGYEMTGFLAQAVSHIRAFVEDGRPLCAQDRIELPVRVWDDTSKF